eukprot:Gb_40476 [translate_table: standard]
MLPIGLRSVFIPVLVGVSSTSFGREGLSFLLSGFMPYFVALCVKAPSALSRVLAGVASQGQLLLWGFLDSLVVGFSYPLKSLLWISYVWSPSMAPRLPGSMAATVALSSEGSLLTPGVLLVGWLPGSMEVTTGFLTSSRGLFRGSWLVLRCAQLRTSGYPFMGSYPRLYWRLLVRPVHRCPAWYPWF